MEPTKEYGFVFCEATDPEREEYWCPWYSKWQNPEWVDLETCERAHRGGKHWRKPEPKVEFGKWICRSDSEPMSKTCTHVLVSDGKRVWSEELPLWGRATHWMPVPPPPEPEKSEAEKAWEKYKANEQPGFTPRSAFIAGFEARGKQ